MIKCPNCGHEVDDETTRCSFCGFDLEKFRQEYFSDRNKRPTDQDLDQKMLHRSLYQQEFKPKKQNTTVAAMIAWVRTNATIVFLLGVILLILMSFSRALGWFSFAALMVWLFVVCDKDAPIAQDTVDKRLTDKVNQVGSNLFNSVETQEVKVRTRRQTKVGTKPHDVPIRKRHTALQIYLAMMALVSLLVIFFGPFASYSMMGYTGISIAHTLISAGRLGGKYALISYGLWALFVFVPILILILLIRNRNKSEIWIFVLSLLETIVLIYLSVRLIFMNAGASVGIGSSEQMMSHDMKTRMAQTFDNLVAFGVSSYMLLISSTITTVLAWKNWFAQSKKK